MYVCVVAGVSVQQARRLTRLDLSTTHTTAGGATHTHSLMGMAAADLDQQSRADGVPRQEVEEDAGGAT